MIMSHDLVTLPSNSLTHPFFLTQPKSTSLTHIFTLPVTQRSINSSGKPFNKNRTTSDCSYFSLHKISRPCFFEKTKSGFFGFCIWPSDIIIYIYRIIFANFLISSELSTNSFKTLNTRAYSQHVSLHERSTPER